MGTPRNQGLSGFVVVDSSCKKNAVTDCPVLEIAFLEGVCAPQKLPVETF